MVIITLLVSVTPRFRKYWRKWCFIEFLTVLHLKKDLSQFELSKICLWKKKDIRPWIVWSIYWLHSKFHGFMAGYFWKAWNLLYLLFSMTFWRILSSKGVIWGQSIVCRKICDFMVKEFERPLASKRCY